MSRVQRIDTYICDRRVVAMRYRISSVQFCPWLISFGEDVLPSDRNLRGRMLSRLYRETSTSK